MKFKTSTQILPFLLFFLLSLPAVSAVTDGDWEEVTKLVEAGKKQQAIAKLDALITDNPDNQKLKDQRARLAAPATEPQGGKGNLEAAMSDEDRLEFNTINRLVAKLRDRPDPAEQRQLQEQILERSLPMVTKYPKELKLWLLRANAALNLDKSREGWEAAVHLKDLGALSSNDEAISATMAELNLKKWIVDDYSIIRRSKELQANQEIDKVKQRWVGVWRGRVSKDYSFERPGIRPIQVSGSISRNYTLTVNQLTPDGIRIVEEVKGSEQAHDSKGFISGTKDTDVVTIPGSRTTEDSSTGFDGQTSRDRQTGETYKIKSVEFEKNGRLLVVQCDVRETDGSVANRGFRFYLGADAKSILACEAYVASQDYSAEEFARIQNQEKIEEPRGRRPRLRLFALDRE